MSKYSVIDTGSNTIRLVVYEVSDGKKEISKYKDISHKKLFKNIVDEKITAGLANYVQDGIISDAGIQAAQEDLSDLLEIAKNVESDKIRIFATAVLRNCENSKEAVKQIEKAIGHEVEILSPQDEAHLGYIGATCSMPASTGTLIDIGGGSTELTALTKKGDEHNVSLGIGSVSSYAAHVKMILPTGQEIEQISYDFEMALKELDDLRPYESNEIYGIGGSVRAVMKICTPMLGSKSRLRQISLHELDRLFYLLESEPSKFAHLAVRTVPDRLHSLVPGATILRTCMRLFNAEILDHRRYGVREGYLLERMLKL